MVRKWLWVIDILFPFYAFLPQNGAWRGNLDALWSIFFVSFESRMLLNRFTVIPTVSFLLHFSCLVLHLFSSLLWAWLQLTLCPHLIWFYTHLNIYNFSIYMSWCCQGLHFFHIWLFCEAYTGQKAISINSYPLYCWCWKMQHSWRVKFAEIEIPFFLLVVIFC